MSEESNRTILLRRILVAVDTSAHSRAALEAAATLASITEANIHGIFVQEEHWSRVSRLPSIKAVNELTGKSQALEEDSLNEQVKMLEQRLRRQLKTISRQKQIHHSWKTTRGKVAQEILSAAEDADLITIGGRGRSFLRTKKLGSTAKTVIRKADKPILVLKKGLELGKTVSVVYDGTEQSQKGLKLALSLAQKNDGRLSVLVVNNHEKPSERDKSVEEMVDSASIPVRVAMLDKPDIGDFIQAVNRQHAGLLVIPKSQPFLQGDALETTVQYLNCPVLMIH